MFGVDSPIQISPSYDARWEVDSCLNASDIKSLSVLHLNVPPVTNIVASAATNGIKGETDATELEQSIAQSNAKCQLISAGRVEELKIWEVVAPVDSANDLSSRLEAQSRQLWALIEYFKVYASDFEVDLLPDPIGEGECYEASCKDLRPSLDWSPEHGWSIPTPTIAGIIGVHLFGI